MSNASKLGFGCVGLSALPFERTALKLLNTVYDAGITHFDTAPIYGKGFSEKILGKFLKTHRNEISVTTKFGLSYKANTNLPSSVALPLNYLKKTLSSKPQSAVAFEIPALLPLRIIGVDEIRLSFEASLKNLSTDCVDNFLLHEALPSFITDEALKYITDLKTKGLAKKIGIAAPYTSINTLKSSSILQWDIVQYENSILHKSDYILNVFPDKTHIYHSILKPLKYNKYASPLKNDVPGILLSRAIKLNQNGISLFSTSKCENVKANLKTIEKYDKYSLSALNEMIENAVY